jgi:formate C-acetyltransferase
MARKFAEPNYDQRLEVLLETKMKQTREKQQLLGYMDVDDHGRILPPPELREIIELKGLSGEMVKEAKLNNFEPKSNHPSGGFFGPKACGENFGRFLEVHPVYIDPMSSIAGGYMAYFTSYIDPTWNPDYDCSELKRELDEYGVFYVPFPGYQHFCQDMAIGFNLGWGGILEKIRKYRKVNPESQDLYVGLENVVLGIQNWISRTAKKAREMAQGEKDSVIKRNLEEMAEINERLIVEPPETFREAVQWSAWYQMVARAYNGSGSMGQLDVLLYPYYEKDMAHGILTDEEATFHIACLLLNDSQYYQLGGPDINGKDQTNRLSFLFLEAIHQLKIPTNIAVSVYEGIDPKLVHRSLEIMFQDKSGTPKFMGNTPLIDGFIKNGYPLELARQRTYSGCHWLAIPGKEYTLNDQIKVNFVALFDHALRSMMNDFTIKPCVMELWRRFENGLRHAIGVIAKAVDFQIEYMPRVFPELALDLLCYGPIEKGLDASGGGLEYCNIGVDGSSIATAADSFAAVEQRIEKEHQITWKELMKALDNDFKNSEDVRLMLRSVPRFGRGGTSADKWAIKISRTFTRLVKEKPTPKGYNMIPGLFSWALQVPMGRNIGATPNGRHAHEPISQGANPEPGFINGLSAPTALATAVASVQCGYGNTAPWQFDIDPAIVKAEGGIDKVEALIRGHFKLGGTLINMNVLDKKKILEANKNPSKYPDLVVRVTGFSAYFASLSPELRQLVVDRIVAED